MIDKLAWGAKVSQTFIDRLVWIVDDLQIGYGRTDGVNKMMACMAWESNETFSPDVTNMAGSGATGLIQFMPTTAKSLGTTTTELAAMTAEDQLNYVWKYFSPYKGKLKTLGDIYMAILWPRGVGKSEAYVLWDKASKPTTYRQNSGIDYDRDGVITKAEATAKVAAKLSKGLSPPYVTEVLTNPLKDTEEAGTEPVDTTPDKTEEPDVVVEREEPEQGNTEAPVEQKHWWDKFSSLLDGQFTGILFIAGALLLNPDFAAKLGTFTLALARGESAYGALASVVGAGLLVIANQRQRQRPK